MYVYATTEGGLYSCRALCNKHVNASQAVGCRETDSKNAHKGVGKRRPPSRSKVQPKFQILTLLTVSNHVEALSRLEPCFNNQESS